MKYSKKEAKLVKEIFDLRCEWKAFTAIARITKNKYKRRVDFNFSSNRIQRLIGMKFYYGVFTWNKQEIIWKHEPIISKDIYDKANNIWKWTHEKTATLKNPTKKDIVYHFKGFAKDEDGMTLVSYTQKDIKYYWQQRLSKRRVSINENMLFDKVWEYIRTNDKPNKILTDLEKKYFVDEIVKLRWKEHLSLEQSETLIKNLREKQNKLLDMKLENLINNELYLSKNNTFENDIKQLLEEKERLKNDDFRQKTQYVIELAGSLYRSYFRANNEWKAFIIKKLGIELFVSNKKELQIAETPLFKSLKILNISYGIPERLDIRTYLKYLSMVDFEDLVAFCKF